jgi:hypothetical protein
MRPSASNFGAKAVPSSMSAWLLALGVTPALLTAIYILRGA